MALLHFSPDGSALVTGGDALTIHESNTPARVIAAGPVDAVAAFADQIWTVRGAALSRWSLPGRSLGDPLPLPHADGALVAAPSGTPSAVWANAVAIADDLGSLATDAIDDAGDLVIPVARRRWVCAAGATLVLPGRARVSFGRPIRGGSAVFDGSAVAVLTEAGDGVDASVVSLSTARLVQRLRLPRGPVAFAALRGLAVVATRPGCIEVYDLRLARRVGVADVDIDVDDRAVEHAVDRSGRWLALRTADGAVAVHDLAELLARPRREAVAIPVAAPVELPPPPAPPEPPGPIEPPPEPPPPLGRPRLRALRPRSPARPIERGAALDLLDRELDVVAARTLHAIAVGWDSRRIGYADESQHPFELEAAALLGIGGGHAREHVAATERRVHAAVAARDAAPHARAAASPLGALIRELSLSPLAAEILLAVAAPILRGEVGRLYGILANDPDRPLIDELLLGQLMAPAGVRPHDIARELEPHRPLLRLGVLQVGARPRPFAALTVEPVIVARLRREPVAAHDGATSRRTADRSLDQLRVPRAVLLRACDALARRPEPGRFARVAVRGAHGSGRRTLLAALAATARRPLAVIDATLLPRSPDAFPDALRAELRRAHLRGWLPCVARLDEVGFGEDRGADVAADVLRRHPGPLTLCLPAEAPVPLAPGHLCLDLPVPSEEQRLAAWRDALARHRLSVHDPEGLAARYRIGPGVVERACAEVARGDRSDDERAAIEEQLRQARDLQLGDRARRVARLASWPDVVLPPDVTDSLRELIGRARHGRTVYERWGFDRTIRSARGLTALFQGQPGTGKTLVAGIIARELGLELYQVDLSRVVSKWLGETERNLGAVFDAAQDGQVLLLFDEADSLFARRTEVKSSHDRYANLEVNYLLQRLDAFEGIAILTTNLGGAIDPAFKRRISFRLTFPFPDEETREQLWRAHLPPELPVRGALDLAGLARKYQLAGGYIRNACLRAAFLAAQEETPLSQPHLERAVILEFQEMGKLSTTGAIA